MCGAVGVGSSKLVVYGKNFGIEAHPKTLSFKKCGGIVELMRFDASGGLLSPARMTVFHNAILVQEDVPLTGPTARRGAARRR